MDPYNDSHRRRLFTSTRASYKSWEPFRKLVRGLVDEYTGPGYCGRANQQEVLLNLMNQAIDAYTMSLVANRPRVLISTKKYHLNYFARLYQESLNNLIQEIGLEYTLRDAVLNAFFCLGVVKLHLADAAPVLMENDIWMNPGEPFASCLALDNFCCDVGAQRYDQVTFAGDSYRVPFEDLKSDLYDQEIVKDLHPTSKYNLTDTERLEFISKGQETDHDEFEPRIDLMDMWIPDDGRVYTFVMDPTDRFTSQHPPVAGMDWDGPEHGPYRLLGYNDVPENIMPVSPAGHLAGLARLANNLMEKQSTRARLQRDLFTYTPAGKESARRVKTAGDNEFIAVQDQNELKMLKVGGIDGSIEAFKLGVIEMFDRMAGNLSAKLGLGPQTDTVGQEKLIHGAVSVKEAFMQARTIDFASGIIKDLGKMLWDDQAKTVPGRLTVEGAPEYSAEVTWRPGHREGRFNDYDFEVDVFSMPHQSPSQRVQSLNQLLTGIYIPMSEQLSAQGGSINLQELTDIYAELMNLPRLKRVIQFTTPAAQEGPESGGMPAQTSREYIRRSVPTGGTQQGRSHVERQAWLAAAQGDQQQQAA
jgi:hypothetical protein